MSDDSLFCACLSSGVSHVDPFELYAWALYDRRIAESFLAKRGMTLGDDGAAEELSGFYPYHRGVGRGFGDSPYIKASPFKVLVLQRRGLDV